MKQQDYETIISCIQFGAPALAPSLINDLNKTIESSNNWIQYQKKLAAGKQSEQEAGKDLESLNKKAE